MTHRTKYSIYALIIATLLGGCAGGSSVRLDDASLSGERSAMWEDGKRAANSGEAMVATGERRLTSGRQQVRDGEAMVGEGNQAVLQARQDYQDAVQAAESAGTQKNDRAQAARLQAIGKRWAAAIEQIKNGNALVDRGNKNITRAQNEIREGRLLLETGSVLMRNSQRARLGQSMLPKPAGN